MVLDTGSELSLLLYARNNVMSFGPRSSATFVAVPCASAHCRSRDLPSPRPATGRRAGAAYRSPTRTGPPLTARSRPTFPPLCAAFRCIASVFDSSPDGVPSAGLLGMNRGALSFVSRGSTPHFSCYIFGRDDAGVLLLGLQQRPAHLPPLNYKPLYQPALPLPYFDGIAYSVQLMSIRVGEEGDRGD
ncbi:hypothetical protein VPH35_116064 [Triticum aestivum]